MTRFTYHRIVLLFVVCSIFLFRTCEAAPVVRGLGLLIKAGEAAEGAAVVGEAATVAGKARLVVPAGKAAQWTEKAAAGSAKVGEGSLDLTMVKYGSGLTEDAYEAMAFGKRVQSIEAVARLASAHPGWFRKTIPYSDEFPFLKIRTFNGGYFDKILLDLAHERFDHTLGQAFDKSELRIVTFSLGEPGQAARDEAVRFSRWLPSANRDAPEALLRLAAGNGSNISYAEMVAELRKFRGKTILLIGHVRSESGAFLGPDGAYNISIQAWQKAAYEARVNIIPIGCNTADFSSIGVGGFINSGDVLRRVVQVINENPKTMGGFWKIMTGDDLTIVMDPLNFSSFSQNISIVNNKTHKIVGYLPFPARMLTWRPLTSENYIFSNPDFSPCLSEYQADDFEKCSISTQINASKEEELFKSQAAEFYRQNRILKSENDISIARHTVALAFKKILLMSIPYSLSVALFAFGLSYATKARFAEKQASVPIWRPARIRAVVMMCEGAPGDSPKESAASNLLMVILVGFVPIIAIFSVWFGFLLVGIITVVGALATLGMLSRSGAKLFAAVVAAQWLFFVWPFTLQAGRINDARDNLHSLHTVIASLPNKGPNAAWREDFQEVLLASTPDNPNWPELQRLKNS